MTTLSQKNRKIHPGVNFIDHTEATNLTVEAGGNANDFADGDKVLAKNPAYSRASPSAGGT